MVIPHNRLPAPGIAVMLRSVGRAGGRSAAMASGFTLMEMLLACGLMALLVGGAASTLAVANRSSARQGSLAQLDALIDQDLAAIQALDRRFSCCAGNPCTASQATISAAATYRDAGGASRPPGNENYYSPRQGSTPSSAEVAQWNTFKAACSDFTIATTFRGQIAALPAASTAAGISRSITDGTNPNDPDQRAAHRLRITYAGSIANRPVVTRVVNLVPTAANWCP